MDILTVSVDSLARYAGVIDDGQGDQPDAIRSRFLKTQLGILQSKPQTLQAAIHHEFAAKYLPQLVEKFKSNIGVLNPATTLLNVISYTSYFIRYSRTPAGLKLAEIQTKRTVEAICLDCLFTADEVGELGQFLSTLLVLQGTSHIGKDDRKVLVPKLKEWERVYDGRLASNTSDRCLFMINNDPGMRPMMESVKTSLESKIKVCGAPSCQRECQENGKELMQCGR